MKLILLLALTGLIGCGKGVPMNAADSQPKGCQYQGTRSVTWPTDNEARISDVYQCRSSTGGFCIQLASAGGQSMSDCSLGAMERYR